MSPTRAEGAAPDRPAYRSAAVVGLVVLAGYLATLAPSVTFWDAGEFIAAAKVLGIPHPPGTPLFVLISHVWATLVPIGAFAFRTNLLSATLSAAGAAFWFLIAHAILGNFAREAPPALRTVMRTGGASAGALIAAFSFTNWQNSNETEVYAAATFLVAVMSWLALQWRGSRGSVRAVRYLLLIAYLGGLSISNHLMSLLVGPPIVIFLIAELRLAPASSVSERRAEWAHVGLVAGLWVLLIGAGLGNSSLALFGSVGFLLAIGWAGRTGRLWFAAGVLGLAVLGLTPYLYVYLRSAQHPILNEGGGETWVTLLAIVRRAQYQFRTPLDDPTVLHGSGNPGRTLSLFALQLQSFVLYFDWQWAKSLHVPVLGLSVRAITTLLFASLGLRGAFAHVRSDRASFWLLFSLFLIMSLGLVIYMNFKPGYSLGWERYPNGADHEVRDRDYFFVVSFVVWSLWVGMGLSTAVRGLVERLRGGVRVLAVGLFAVGLFPFALNFRAADRRRIPDVNLPADFAYDLLNSVPPYGILFTFGDNDTFPLWWAQEVGGIRRDVTVICQSLAETDWTMRQIRDNPVRTFDEASAPERWRGRHPVLPSWPIHSMSDREIAASGPRITARPTALIYGKYSVTLPAGTTLYAKDILAIRVIQQNFGRRPIAWALPASGNYYGLQQLALQQGLVVMLDSLPTDRPQQGRDPRGGVGVPLDVEATEGLVDGVYRYGALAVGDRPVLESTSAGIAATLAIPLTQLGLSLGNSGNLQRAVRYLERAVRLTDNPAVQSALNDARRRVPSIVR